jgi:hypothetical protein
MSSTIHVGIGASREGVTGNPYEWIIERCSAHRRAEKTAIPSNPPSFRIPSPGTSFRDNPRLDENLVSIFDQD